MKNIENIIQADKGAKGKGLEERLNAHPVLKARMESILAMVENEGGEIEKADDAELRAIEEMRKLGNEVLHAWAQRQQQRKSEEQKRQKGGAVRRHGKKNSTGIRVSEKFQ